MNFSCDALAAELPDYMVPARFILLDALPLTPNGKIDRNSLEDSDAAASEQEFVAPVGDAESKLAGIWQEVLGVERVGRHDDLFELGADSILIFRLATRAKQAGLDLPVAEFFRSRRVATLCRR